MTDRKPLRSIHGLASSRPRRETRSGLKARAAVSDAGGFDSPLLELDNVEKRYGGITAVAGVSLDVNRGEFAAILGPNGAGKTTLLSVIAGEQHPSRGTIRYDGADITDLDGIKRARIGIGRTFQVGRAFRSLTVRENIALAREVSRSRSWRLVNSFARECYDDEIVNGLLDQVALTGRANAAVMDLTQAELKVLDIAMALALQPRLLLLDEPTAGVGTEEANSLVELVQSVWMNTPGLSVLFISHDIRIVFNVARRIIFMRGGAVVFDGPPEDARESERLRSLYLGEEI